MTEPTSPQPDTDSEDEGTQTSGGPADDAAEADAEGSAAPAE